MNVTNLFKIAIRAIAANKLRSFLTALGIIIGVGSVITMMAIGEGSKSAIQAQIASMGANSISVQPGQNSGPGGARLDASAMQTLKLSDYEVIKEEAKYLTAITPTVNSSGQFVYGNNNTPASLTGVAPDYLKIRSLTIKDGEMFTETDVRTSAKVCVIGKTIVNELFPDGTDPVGKIIRFKSIPMRVVGVLTPKGYSTFGQDQDNVVLAPYSTVMKRIQAATYVQGISAAVVSDKLTDLAIEDVTQILRRLHKIKDDVADDFTLRSTKEFATMISSTSDTMSTLLLCVACISLVVGGIGIMNIMYVSVTERTKEIGLRMSVGARGIDILSQFLIEAIFLSLAGGLIGVLMGILASYGVNVFAGWPIEIEVWTVIVSFVVCTAIGVFFGFYPAKRAANLDPIEALRYE